MKVTYVTEFIVVADKLLDVKRGEIWKLQQAGHVPGAFRYSCIVHSRNKDQGWNTDLYYNPITLAVLEKWEYIKILKTIEVETEIK